MHSQPDSNDFSRISSLLESKEHTIDIQEKTDAFVKQFQGGII